MGSSSISGWISRPRPNPQAKLRLLCFPYAGGGAAAFRAWSAALPAHFEVCAVQYPGRENRWQEPLCTSLDELLPALANGLQAEFDRPCAFFGYSLGALVAFELARLRAQQQQPGPVHLFVAAHAAPHLSYTDPPLHTLAQPEFIRKLTDFNGTPQEILHNAELMELVYPILRADFTMNETYLYRPGPPLTCRLSAFGGLSDQLVSRSELEAWREHTQRDFSLRMLPGDHFFMHSMQALLLRSMVQDLTLSLGQLNGSRS